MNAGTQVLVNAGSGPDSVADDKSARRHEDPTATTVFDGYKLAENSPAINAGKVVVDRNGYTIDHDFFGHKITAVPEIGAAESDAVAALVLRSNVYTVTGTNVSDLPKNTTVEDFLNNVIVDTGVTVTIKEGETELKGTDIVKGGATITLSYEGMESVTYTVVASSDKELKGCFYEVKGTEVRVPYTEKNPTTVKEMKANVTVADTATVSVLNGKAELADTDTVAAGMTLRITAEDGKTKDFTITQKNEYNWTFDFVRGQQGNVWFGQIKDSSSDWTNMTTIDSDGWPNWATHTYYGPGIDAPQNTNTTTDPTVHGLLSAPPRTDISTAMAYRVPKSGTVSFKIRDDEPYLRQSSNTGGTVTLSLYVNGKEKKSLTLETSRQKVGNWEQPEEIAVSRGDMIRVVTKCNGNPSKPSVHVTPIITYVDKAAADTEAPTAPTEVTATDITTTTAKVTWTASTDNVGVTGYNVYVNDSETPVNGETLVTGTEYALESLTAGTEYKVTVKAVDAAGNVSEGAVHTFTTENAADTEAPTAPENVAVTDVTTTTAKVTWSEATDNVGVVGYNVYLNEAKVNETLITTTEYDLTALTEETNYSVKVTAVDAAENESGRSEAATFTTPKTQDTEAPSVPAGVTASDVTQTGAKITWTASADNVGVAGYNVYVDETKVNTDKLVEGLELELTGLTPETEYTVTVSAVDAAGNESGRSAAFTFTTLKNEEPAPEKPSAPTNVKVSEITHTTAIVTWEPAAERAMAPGYNVYLDDKKQNELPIEGTEYKLTGLKVGTRYNVAVTVVDVDGIESDRTEEVEDTFITKADKEKLQETAKDVDKVLENKGNYTEESLKNLEEIYKKYQEVLNGDNVTQEEVEKANAEIKKAFDELKAKDDDKRDDGKKDDGKQDDGKKEDPKKDPTPTPGPATPTPTTTPTPSTTPQSGAKPAAPSGNTNTGRTNAGGATTGSTSTTRVAKTGDTANTAAWLFTLAASAVAGTVIVKRKRED